MHRTIYTTRNDHRIAWFTALATTIYIAESALPTPIPGIKPGLANIVTIAILMRFGWQMAAWVNLLRVVAGSLLIGTFLSPTFILGLSGALASTVTLILLSFIPRCGALGYSVAAAMSHMLAQFWVAYWLFIHHDGLFRLLPLLMTAAFVFGLVSGLIAMAMVNKLSISAK